MLCAKCARFVFQPSDDEGCCEWCATRGTRGGALKVYWLSQVYAWFDPPVVPPGDYTLQLRTTAGALVAEASYSKT